MEEIIRKPLHSIAQSETILGKRKYDAKGLSNLKINFCCYFTKESAFSVLRFYELHRNNKLKHLGLSPKCGKK